MGCVPNSLWAVSSWKGGIWAQTGTKGELLWWWRQRPGWCVEKSRNARDCMQTTQSLERGMGQILPQVHWWSQACPDLDLGALASKTVRQYLFVVLCHLVSDTLLRSLSKLLQRPGYILSFSNAIWQFRWGKKRIHLFAKCMVRHKTAVSSFMNRTFPGPWSPHSRHYLPSADWFRSSSFLCLSLPFRRLSESDHRL